MLCSDFCAVELQIPLKETDSYLIYVEGTFGKVAGVVTITSLTFVTNKRTYGPFGIVRGTHFQTFKHGRIVGFFGKSSTQIDSLGVFTRIRSENSAPKAQIKNVGPFGGQGGVAFHDGHGEIREINVLYTKHQVVSLQVVYKQGGMLLHASHHGASSKGSHVHHTKVITVGLSLISA